MKDARAENTRGQKKEETNSSLLLYLSCVSSVRAACYPALHVLSSQLSVSVMRFHVAQKTEGVSISITAHCKFNIKHHIKHREDYDRRQIWAPGVETLDFTIRICSTPTFLYFDFYLNTANAANVYLQPCLFYNYNVNRKEQNIIQ